MSKTNPSISNSITDMNYIHKIKALLIGVFILSSLNAFSQTSNLLYYLENIPQSNYTNAAMMPRANGFIGFPGFSSIAFNLKSDIAAKDLIQKSGDIWVQPLDAAFEFNQFYQSIGKSASIKTSLSYAPIFFGFRTGKGYFTFSLQQKTNARFGLPKDLFSIAENGFSNGKTLDLKLLESKLTAYHEISIGYAHKINKYLTVGAHIKPLSGIAAAQMRFDKLSLTNNRTNYYLDVDGSLLLSIPFIELTPNEDGFPEDFKSKDDISTSDIISNAIPNFSNFGVALDLGVVYDLNQKFSFSAALNNLGYINWKSNLNYTSVKGSYEFTGPTIEIGSENSIEDEYQAIGDSIIEVMNGTTGQKSFSTGLAPELMVGSIYNVNHVIGLGFLSKSTFEKFNFRQEFIFSANLNMYKGLTTNIAYNYEIGGSRDLGLGLALNSGPAQFYILANHIPFYFDKIKTEDSQFIAPTKAESFSIMLGINLVFGKNGYRNKPMIQ